MRKRRSAKARAAYVVAEAGCSGSGSPGRLQNLHCNEAHQSLSAALVIQVIQVLLYHEG